MMFEKFFSKDSKAKIAVAALAVAAPIAEMPKARAALTPTMDISLPRDTVSGFPHEIKQEAPRARLMSLVGEVQVLSSFHGANTPPAPQVSEEETEYILALQRAIGILTFPTQEIEDIEIERLVKILEEYAAYLRKQKPAADTVDSMQ